MVTYNYIKRFFDILFSIFCILFLSPFLLFISILIFYFEGKPIIYKQTRVGLNNKLFTFYKFRSMPKTTKSLPSSEIEKIKISKLGLFIRRLSIDELPQLFNILCGDMSFVGPRPCIDSQKELINLRKLNGSYKLRPGLTGLAQIKSYDFMKVSVKAKLDGIYYKKYNFIYDFYILFSTFAYLFKSPPTY